MNKKTLIAAVILLIVLAAGFYYYYSTQNNDVAVVNSPNISIISITYTNPDYGFNFTLPIDWEGYSIVKETWQGNALTKEVASSGPKLLIRNPKWSSTVSFEDLPILVFTISQWNSYLAGNFAVSAAPIQASELGRNNVYVFALPPRWDFDYSLGYEEAQNIIIGKPLQTFNLI